MNPTEAQKEWNKLNLKIATWLGFKEKYSFKDELNSRYISPRWEYQDGELYSGLDFINDANAQNQWIVPKIRKDEVVIVTHIYSHFTCVRIGIHSEGEAENPTIAFALAVEKYIDSLEKK